MSLVELCKKGDLEEVKAALQRGVDVNTKDEDGWTGLILAVKNNHNSVAALLLKTPNIDVNLQISDMPYGSSLTPEKNYKCAKITLYLNNYSIWANINILTWHQ